MGRLSKELLEQIRKNPPTYWHGSRGITLFEHIDAIELELKISKEDEQEAVREFEKAMQSVDRLSENVAQLQRELTEAREAKKVALPKEVVDALDDFKDSGSDIDYIIGVMIRLEVDNPSPRLKAVRDYARINGHALIYALLNGYTVEQTKEERLREGIEKLIEQSDWNPTTMANNVADFVTKFNAENE